MNASKHLPSFHSVLDRLLASARHCDALSISEKLEIINHARQALGGERVVTLAEPLITPRSTSLAAAVRAPQRSSSLSPASEFAPALSPPNRSQPPTPRSASGGDLRNTQSLMHLSSAGDRHYSPATSDYGRTSYSPMSPQQLGSPRKESQQSFQFQMQPTHPRHQPELSQDALAMALQMQQQNFDLQNLQNLRARYGGQPRDFDTLVEAVASALRREPASPQEFTYQRQPLSPSPFPTFHPVIASQSPPPPFTSSYGPHLNHMGHNYP